MISALFTNSPSKDLVQSLHDYLNAYLTEHKIPTLPLDQASQYGTEEVGLFLENNDLSLQFLGGANVKPIRSEFISTDNFHRLSPAKIKHEMIVKACGLTKTPNLHILDATAGLGRDSLVLAAAGAAVSMQERHPVIASLLAHGLANIPAHESFLYELSQNLTFSFANSGHYQSPDQYDVVYLDPMFPARQKSAKVKKEMLAFHQVVDEPDEQDEQALFDVAAKQATKRIVVKRPPKAPVLAGQKPSYELVSKACRFDVYLNFR